MSDDKFTVSTNNEAIGGAGGYSVDSGAAAAEGIAAAAATTAASIGIGAAIGSAIPIPGIGTAVGAAVGAIVAGFNALGGALKSTFHPFPVDLSGEMWVLAHLDPHAWFDLHVDAATEAHDYVRLIRYFRVRAGMVPDGYLGNNGSLYDPVSSWARVMAGTDCGNPYLCATDPRDPMTDEGYIQKLMNQKPGTPAVIRSAVEAREVLFMLRKYIQIIAPSIPQTLRDKVRPEIIQLRRLAGEVGKDDVLSSVFGDVSVPDLAFNNLVTWLVGGTALLAIGGVALWHATSERKAHAKRKHVRLNALATLSPPQCEIVTRYAVSQEPAKKQRKGSGMRGSSSEWLHSYTEAEALLEDWQKNVDDDYRVEVVSQSWVSYDGGLTGYPMSKDFSPGVTPDPIPS